MVGKDWLRWDGRAAMIAGLVGLALMMVWFALVAGVEPRPAERGREALVDLPDLPSAAPEPAPRPPPLPRLTD